MFFKKKAMRDLKHYIIRGGVEGRERLRILSRVMHQSTSALLDQLGIAGELVCLDVGCGGGDVTQELARRVAPKGMAIGADIDATKIEIARREAAELGINNIEFRLLDIREQQPAPRFDLVYARFLLTHLPNPVDAVDAIYAALKPGGLAVIEDIDASGCFVFPASRAFWRFHELYCTAVRKRGGDPNIGPRLPMLLKDAGFAKVNFSVVQPMALEGEAKLLNPLTMENIADAAVEAKLTSHTEIAALVEELYSFAADPNTLAGAPRVVQTWGRKPAL